MGGFLANKILSGGPRPAGKRRERNMEKEKKPAIEGALSARLRVFHAATERGTGANPPELSLNGARDKIEKKGVRDKEESNAFSTTGKTSVRKTG